jgi:hypothetical protein
MISLYVPVSILLSALLFAVSALREKAAPPAHAGSATFPVSLARALFFAAFFLAAARQVYLCRLAFGGITSTDEHSFARIYSQAIEGGRLIYGGFTQGVMAVALNAWYRAFGPSITAARAFSSVVGLSGILLYVRLLRKEFAGSTAYLAAAMLCLSAYFTLFSCTALEVVAVFFFVPLCLLNLRGHMKFPGSPFVGGVLLAASFFTYPGVNAFWIALLLSWLLCGRRDLLGFLASVRARKIFIAFLLAFAVFLELHLRYRAPLNMYSVYGGLFQGAGELLWDATNMINSVNSNCFDMFFGGSSWYTSLLRNATFLEQSLWGVFLLGAYTGWKSRDARLRSLLLAMFVVFMASLAISAIPGMRRAVAALLPAYLICALGLEEFWRLVAGPARWLLAALVLVVLSWNAFFLVPASLAGANPYLATPGNVFPDNVFLETLSHGDLYLDPKEYAFDLDHLAVTNFRSLEIQFGPGRPLGEIHFQLPLPKLGRDSCAYVLTWQEPILASRLGAAPTSNVTVFSERNRRLHRLAFGSRGGVACPP